MDDESIDRLVRAAAFDFLVQETRKRNDDVLPYALLTRGFDFDGTRVPLIGPQGIFKPRVIPRMPLSITTTPIVEGKDRPYADEQVGDVIRYRYRGTDPNHHENVGLRLAMSSGTPLIYFFGVVRGMYLPSWPVYVVADDPVQLTFSIMVDNVVELGGQGAMAGRPSDVDARRRYVTVVSQRRMHQQCFRHRVLEAYRGQCAICRLKHTDLLAAAHILPDGHPRGDPIVPNGVALCDLHHKTFDRNYIAIRPDLTVEVRRDLLAEEDGPMLLHGIKGFHNAPLILPRSIELRPDRNRLEERYAEFRRAAG